jgi:hypothetical protein
MRVENTSHIQFNKWKINSYTSNRDPTSQFHKEMWRTRSHGATEFPTGEEYMLLLPHHPVFKETISTARLMLCFYGSAKTSNGLSLNDIQVGATVEQDLYSIVLRFRTHQVCFTADIAKMYRQIVVHPQDRDLQGILWRFLWGTHPRVKLTTVTYGTSSAPFLAPLCLKKL